MLNDNPHFTHALTYNIHYTDSNVNREPDPDEYVNSVIPTYNGVDPNETSKFVQQHVREVRMANDNDQIKSLRIIYDEILGETELVARGGRPASSGSHGAVIDHAADDLGIARAIGDYAQRLGFYCFVADVNIADIDMAIVRVKIDDTWYNIAPRFDYVQISHNVTAIPLAEDGKATHIYFFMSDEMLFYDTGALDKFDEKYLPILPLNIDETEEEPEVWSYYFDKYLEKNYHMETVEEAYDALLEETKNVLDSGGETVELYIFPNYVDTLWAQMGESYISDLSEKYGMTVTGFTGEYSMDAMYVTLEQ